MRRLFWLAAFVASLCALWGATAAVAAKLTQTGKFEQPTFDYPHDESRGAGLHGCSIIGADVVGDQGVPDVYGRYLYGDYCNRGALPVAGSSLPRSRLARHRHLFLSARRLRPGGSRFRVKVRLAPCRDDGGEPTQLNRKGKSFSSKRLDRRCTARFLLTVARPTPLRAFARIGGEGDHVGSRRLVLIPPRR
jgi:hypothetical protein